MRLGIAALRAAFEDAPIGVALVDIDGRLLEVNRSLCEITGYSREQLLRVRIDDLVLPEDVAADRLQAQQLRDGQIAGYRIEKRLVRADGRAVWVALSAALVREEDGEDGPLYVITHIEDVSRREELAHELELVAKSDPLTELCNRTHLDDEIERTMRMAFRYGRPAALLALDVDDFRRINEGFGHQVGDRILTAVADTLRRSVRATDVPARIGGDEFAVLLTESDAHAAIRVAERLAEAVRRLGGENGNAAATTSIGIALVEDGQSAEDLVVAADAAMHAAKRAGGDGFAIAAEATG